jgi:DNA-binding IclR family transcriptional regulator
MSNTAEGRGSALVQSVDRAITVLEFLAGEGQAGITEIAAHLDVHKSTASRLVSVLQSRGLVEQLGVRGKYAIGFGVVRLAGAATNRMDLATLGQSVCQELAESLGETVNMAILDDDVVVNITQARGSSAVAVQNWIGQRTPLHATSSGKVLLAYMPIARRRRILRRSLEQITPRTVVDAVELNAELDRIIEEGYSWCCEEFELGLHAVAVPVYGDQSEVVAAISVSGPGYRLSRKRMRQINGELIKSAADLSANLGYWK